MEMLNQMDDACLTCLILTEEPGSDGPNINFCLSDGGSAPEVDFCADPGNGHSNPDGALFACQHFCVTGTDEQRQAAGCWEPGHEDEVCEVRGVYAPGEEFPWGERCCEWCDDFDGDGNPDYEGCCEGMRSDGQMGCEDRSCDWHCDGVECFMHEDQATCESSGGLWGPVDYCVNELQEQGRYEEDGLTRAVGAAMFLGRYGETCCTGFEPPWNLAGACNGLEEAWVSRLRWCRAMAPVRLRPFPHLCTCADMCVRACRTRSGHA